MIGILWKTYCRPQSVGVTSKDVFEFDSNRIFETTSNELLSLSTFFFSQICQKLAWNIPTHTHTRIPYEMPLRFHGKGIS